MLRRNSGQSIVEYAILLGVIIAALLIMQAFIKRGYQGGLKDSADKMGEQYSAGGTTIHKRNALGAGGQQIVEEVATVDGSSPLATLSGLTPVGTIGGGKSAYSLNTRTGDTMTSTTKVDTDDARHEATRVADYGDVSSSGGNFALSDNVDF
ncbi:MAG: hypothetical protein WC532_08770 [Candidatus Omnitrophota bacterium]